MRFSLPKNPRWYKPRYMLEALLVYLFFGLCALLPLDAASAFGGWLARTIGTRMGVSRRAERHLQRALPALSATERKRIIHGMWDNLGRVGAEYPHLADMMRLNRVVGNGEQIIKNAVADKVGCMIIGAHLANWEIGPIIADSYGMPLAVIYRAPNNPYVDWLIRRARQKIASQTFPKSAEGALALMRHLRTGGHAAILIDQKQNEGISVPFFGRDARTTPAAAEIAIRFNCPVILARVIRTKGAHFKLDVLPVTPPKTGDHAADVAAFTASMTAQLESWIRENPEQWLWLHNRWPKEAAD